MSNLGFVSGAYTGICARGLTFFSRGAQCPLGSENPWKPQILLIQEGDEPQPPVYTSVIRIMPPSRFTDRYTSKLKITWQNIVDLIYLQFTIKIFHIFGFGTRVKPITINLNVKETKHHYQADKSKFYNPYISVACFLSSRTDPQCSPRIAAGEALCLITHLVSYRGSKNCT